MFHQVKLFGEDLEAFGYEAGVNLVPLTKSESRIFDVMAGHAEPDKKKIKALYLDAANWKSLFQQQKNILAKIANARELYLQGLENLNKSPIERVTSGVLQYLEKPKMGLGIEDVSDKSDKGIIDIIKKALGTNTPIESNIKKDAKNIVQNVWEEYIKDKGISVAEKRENMLAIAYHAGIDNPNDFGTKSGNLSIGDSSDDIISFLDVINSNKNFSKAQVKRFSKSVFLMSDTIKKLEYNNVSVKTQKSLAKLLFTRLENTPVEDISLLTLSKKEAKIYAETVASNNHYKEIPEINYLEEALNLETLKTVSEKLAKEGNSALFLAGMRGEVDTVIDFLTTKLPKEFKKPLTELKERFYNHNVIEHTQGGGAYQGMLVDIYKAIQEGAIKDDKYMVTLSTVAQPTTWVRKGKRQYKYGISVFNKKYADNLLVVASPKNYQWLLDRVKSDPKDYVAKKMLKKAKQFHDLAWKDGKIRQDTTEGRVIQIFTDYMKSTRKRIEKSFAYILNEPSLERYLKKNPIDWIDFYVPQIYTNDFKTSYNLKEISYEKRVKKATILETERLIKNFMSDNNKKRTDITDKQYSSLALRAKATVYTNFMEQLKFGRKGITPNILLKRNFDFGLTIKRDIAGKEMYIPVIETNFNAITEYATTANKLIANIQMFPELINLPLTFRSSASMMKLLENVKRDKTGVGMYLATMIERTPGLSSMQTGLDGLAARALSKVNLYASRIFLTLPTSPVKNFMLAQGMNAANNDMPRFLTAMSQSFDFVTRMEAMKTGYMQTSYSALTKEDNTFMSNIVQAFFDTGRFPSSEQVGRLNSIIAAQLNLPILCDDLASKNTKQVESALNELKKIYMVSDSDIKINANLTIPGGEISLLKKYGLGTTEIEVSNKNALDQRRFNKVKFDDFDFPLTGHEIGKIQMILDRVHSKVLHYSHVRTQGSTSPIFQPYWISRFPLLKAGALFSQLAMHATMNSLRLLKLNYDNGNHHRNLHYLAWKLGYTGPTLMALAFLLGSKDYGQLDDTKRARMYRLFHKAEVLDIFSFTWGALNGQSPMSNPVLPFVSMDILFGKDGFLDLLIDVKSATLSSLPGKLGDPRGKGDFAHHWIRNDIKFQGVKKTVNKLAPAWKKYKDYKIRKNNPYLRLEEDQIKIWEKVYKDKLEPFGKVTVMSQTITSPHLREMGDLWKTITKVEDVKITDKKLTNEEMTKMVDSFDFEDFNKAVLYTCQALVTKNMMSPGMTEKRAKHLAEKSIQSKIRSLHPVLNGSGTNEDDVLFSKTTAFKLMLRETARKQIKKNILSKHVRTWEDKDEDYYVKLLDNAEYVYNTIVYYWGVQYQDWVKNQPEMKNDSDIDFFMLKSSFNKKGEYINPTWKELGLDIDKLKEKKLYKEILGN